MRKDVKLGFAIGAVLLVVLIVYVLVVSGDSGNRTVAQGDESADVKDSGVSLEPVDGEEAGATAPVPPPAPAVEYNPPTDPFAAAPSTGAADAQTTDASSDKPSTPRKDDWDKILNEQLVLMTETPQMAGGSPASEAAAPVAGPPGVLSTPPAGVEQPAPPVAEPAPAAVASGEPAAPMVSPPAAQDRPAEPSALQPPTVRPSDTIASEQPERSAPIASAKGREHIVQFGETLSSISAAAYGNPNFYPHILRANPTVDPNRIRPGTKIILPDAATVRPAAAATPAQVAGGSSTPIDATRQYRVQAGDSLHGIALRLYGESSKSEAIYQLNKEMIGVDPHKLRIGQVLQLPSAPAARAARAQ